MRPRRTSHTEPCVFWCSSVAERTAKNPEDSQERYKCEVHIAVPTLQMPLGWKPTCSLHVPLKRREMGGINVASELRIVTNMPPSLTCVFYLCTK